MSGLSDTSINSKFYYCITFQLQYTKSKKFIVEMGKQISNRYQQQKVLQTKSRKQLRKEKKEEKKQKKRQYYQSRSNHSADNHLKKKANIKKQDSNIVKQDTKESKQVPKSRMKSQQKRQKEIQKEKTKKKNIETEDDKLIRLYEQKLGISENKGKYDKLAKNYGFDDDIFDFLDGISKKVNTDNYQYDPDNQEQNQLEQEPLDEQYEQDMNQIEENYQEQQINDDVQQNDQELNIQQEQDDQFDAQFDKMFDHLDEIDQQSQRFEDQDEETIKQQELKNKQKKKKKLILQHQPQQQIQKISEVKQNKSQESVVRKSMNSLLNKLSDGNVLLTFREFVKIIQSHSRSLTIPIYAQLFVRFNLMIEKPLLHILATNVALLGGLHYAFGNRLVAPVLHSLTIKYININAEQENVQEIEEVGYCKKFERLKNYATILSLLYNYGSISGQFIESYVYWLTQSLNKNNIELIYVVIQRCGMQVRQRDPSSLKNIINLIKQSIEKYRVQCEGKEQQVQKIHFIQLELNEIRFNKKTQNSYDQRMAFLETFINKNVKKEIEKEKQVFGLNFENLTKMDVSRTNWWQTQNQGKMQDLDGEELHDAEISEMVKQKSKLMQLAKSFHMVTENKKNIFICLMDSKDYLEATQRILQLKVKNYQDVATVLVQVSTLQPSFNPYYSFVSAKLANLMPKFRMNLQYAIWDHLKLIDQYQLRRTSNLAKFTSKLISDPLSNCSLSMLKFFPDLSNVRAIDRAFLDIFFTYFFKKVKREYLSKLIAKLREENNRDVKLGIQDYLSDFECEGVVMEKAQICRRLLMIEVNQRRIQMNDE